MWWDGQLSAISGQQNWEKGQRPTGWRCGVKNFPSFPDVYFPYIQLDMNLYERLGQAEGFQWNEGNRDKNWISHRVTIAECEQAFFNRPLVAAEDVKHSREEPRFYALGRTNADRKLFLVFTLRGTLIRMISARDMSRRERLAYERYQ